VRRRELLGLALASAASAAGLGCAKEREPKRISMTPAPLAPALFISHGSPMVAVEEGPYQAALRSLGTRLAGVRAVVVLSAHWLTRGQVAVSSAERPETIHDFGGFPEALHRLRYEAQGSTEVAQRVADHLRMAGWSTWLEPRGLDHGAWVPLRHALPAPKVPVLQVSMPYGRPPHELLALGRALRPLREQGVMLVGSGGVTHNLRQVRFEGKDAPLDAWAQDFDRWVWERLEERRPEALAKYADAPGARLSVPTTDHFDPLLCAAGAAQDGEHPVSLHQGFEYGNLSMRTVAWGLGGA
jgi:4,5-DOPA dioxygenase extradiol